MSYLWIHSISQIWYWCIIIGQGLWSRYSLHWTFVYIYMPVIIVRDSLWRQWFVVVDIANSSRLHLLKILWHLIFFISLLKIIINTHIMLRHRCHPVLFHISRLTNPIIILLPFKQNNIPAISLLINSQSSAI